LLESFEADRNPLPPPAIIPVDPISVGAPVVGSIE
jgi:hypothetical protein